MALLSILLSSGGKLDSLELDATLREDHGRSATITDSPVEEGSDLTDHIRLDPEVLTMEGEISRTPVNPKFFGDLKRYKEAWPTLEGLWKNRTPFTVITSLGSYENMAIRSLRVSRTVETSNVIRFTAELRKITIVGATALNSKLADEVADTLGDTVDLGDQTGSAV